MTVAPQTQAHLAIFGGPPVRSTPLPYGRHRIDEADIEAVVEVLRSDWLTTGAKVGEFEAAFADYVGARYAVSFSSGTAALHGAMFAADLQPGDEAITTPLTFCASANCILYQGGRPVFADVCPDTLCLDPDQVKRHLSPQTKVVVPVDYAGHPAVTDELLALAAQTGLIVVEDACHALGAEYQQRRVGQLSTMTMFSFHPVKHITTGEGGMVTTDDPDLARKLRLFRSHGIDRDAQERQLQGQWFYQMMALGYNYRLTDIGCALGLSQLGKLASNLVRRRQIVATYTEAFAGIDSIRTPIEQPGVQSAWHLYPIRLELAQLRGTRKEVFQALQAEGLGVNVHYIPVHWHPYYRQQLGYQGGEYPIAEAAYEQLISLPLFPAMSDRDVEDVIVAVTKVLGYYAS